jgi:FkbM family methyltransferase
MDVWYCFRLLLGRYPSEREWSSHSSKVGTELTQVVGSYLNSPEFQNRRLLHADAKPEGVQLVQLQGFQMYASPCDTYIGAGILRSLVHEPAVTRVFREYIKPGMGVLDVGANIGYFTLLAASLVGSEGSVYAFEPSPANAKMLCASQKANRFDNIVIVQAAATDQPGLLKYFPELTNGSVASLAAESPQDIFSAETVPGVRLDDNLPPEVRIDFMKMDVEGYEFKAAQGAMQTIRRNRPIIVTEFSPLTLRTCCGVAGEEFLRLFIDLGYQAHTIEESRVTPATIQQVMSHFERSGLDHIDLLFVMPR